MTFCVYPCPEQHNSLISMAETSLFWQAAEKAGMREFRGIGKATGRSIAAASSRTEGPCRCSDDVDFWFAGRELADVDGGDESALPAMPDEGVRVRRIDGDQ